MIPAAPCDRLLVLRAVERVCADSSLVLVVRPADLAEWRVWAVEHDFAGRVVGSSIVVRRGSACVLPVSHVPSLRDAVAA